MSKPGKNLLAVKIKADLTWCKDLKVNKEPKHSTGLNKQQHGIQHVGRKDLVEKSLNKYSYDC